MTPRPLDVDVVQRRLADVREAVDHLGELGPLTAQQLADDWRSRAVVERVLTVLVEAAVKCNGHLVTSILGRAPSDYRSSFLDAAAAGAIDPELAERIAPSAGLRDVLVHGYDEVDLAQLVRGAELALDLYPAYVREVAAFVRERAPG
jgi:uncharacterized protein YutE (UPF0331/DUF86 family)